MQTKDLIAYAAIIYLFIMLKKKQTCSCKTAPIPVLPVNNVLVDYAPGGGVPIVPIIPVKDCLNCDTSNIGINSVMNLPIFTKNNNQVEPTPATVLDPMQLAIYNAAAIKGISKKYIC